MELYGVDITLFLVPVIFLNHEFRSPTLYSQMQNYCDRVMRLPRGAPYCLLFRVPYSD